jgi:pre-60S factor REI1
MIKMHSLFLPEQDYLVDLRGLIEYLQTKVAVGNFCLACNKGFRNIEACRAHMASVSHRRIAYTTEEEQMELSDFYDFSSTWESVPDDGEWSDVEGEEGDGEVGEDDEAYDSDETIDSAQLGPVEEDFELRLPSGAVAGHRSLQRYYRQNLRGRDPFAERGGAAVHKAIMDRTQQVRQELVNTSVAGVDKGRKAWSRKHIETFQDMRIREDFKTRTMYKNNNQKHFRDPLLQ